MDELLPGMLHLSRAGGDTLMQGLTRGHRQGGLSRLLDQRGG